MATEDKTLTIEIPKPHGEQYKDIVLSEQNKKNIVREVLRAKGEFQGEFSKEMYDYIVLKEKKREYFRIKREEYSEKIMKIIAPNRLTKEEYLNFLASTFNKRFPNKVLSFQGEEQVFFEMLVCYFTRDNKFFELCHNFSKTPRRQSFSFDKGIILIGQKGIGKTSIMKLFALNPNCPYKVKSIYELISDAEEFKLAGLDKYSTWESVSSFDSQNYYFGNTHIGLCIDDMGVKEEKLKSWGNDRNIIDIVIQQRYFNDVPANATFITTNEDYLSWIQKYDGRTTDRFREMFNIFWYPTIESKRA